MFLKGVHGVFHRFEKELWYFGVDFWLLFLIRLVKASWTPFWPLSSRNLAKRCPAGSLWIIMIFLVAGPPFLGLQRPKSIKKGSGSLYFLAAWTDLSLCRERPGSSKNGFHRHFSSDLHLFPGEIGLASFPGLLSLPSKNGPRATWL